MTNTSPAITHVCGGGGGGGKLDEDTSVTVCGCPQVVSKKTTFTHYIYRELTPLVIVSDLSPRMDFHSDVAS